MTLEDRVCSLEYAKKLNELGVKQESLFTYFKYENSKEFKILYNMQPFCPDEPFELYAAFIVAELLEDLPNQITWNTVEGHLTIIKRHYGYKVSYDLICNGNEHFSYIRDARIRDKKLADALAQLRIYLIENKLVENIN